MLKRNNLSTLQLNRTWLFSRINFYIIVFKQPEFFFGNPLKFGNYRRHFFCTRTERGIIVIRIAINVEHCTLWDTINSFTFFAITIIYPNILRPVFWIRKKRLIDSVVTSYQDSLFISRMWSMQSNVLESSLNKQKQPPEVFYEKKAFLEISQNSQENTCVPKSLF